MATHTLDSRLPAMVGIRAALMLGQGSSISTQGSGALVLGSGTRIGLFSGCWRNCRGFCAVMTDSCGLLCLPGLSGCC